MQEITKRNMRIWSRLGQRGTMCGIGLYELMQENEDMFVLTADLGKLSGMDKIREKFPKRYLNVGIAEQNMIGVASGLAFEGNKVYVTTYATFLTMRCYEQIRHNLGYQNANVKLIGSAAGLVMGMSGNTHYSYEDIAIMRAIPNMVVVSPADATEAYCALNELHNYEGPVYFRLTGGLNCDNVYDENYRFELGKAYEIKSGKDVAIFVTGTMVKTAMEVSDELEKLGVMASVISIPTIKPLQEDGVVSQHNKKLIVTIEEHSIIGGLGSTIAEILTKVKDHPKQVMLGVEDQFLRGSTYENLLEQAGLTKEQIVKRILTELE